jgi:transcription factor TGA
MLTQQLEPLADQQIAGIMALRQSSHQAEEAFTQGHEQLHHAIVDTIAGGAVIDGVQQMVAAMARISNLEGFVHQVNNLLYLQYT